MRYVVAAMSAAVIAALTFATPATAKTVAVPTSRPLSHPSLRLRPARRMAIKAKAQTAIYRVRSGDTLSSIAKKTYGRSAAWPRLWWANRHTVHNPNVIREGQVLVERGRNHTLAHETARALAVLTPRTHRPRTSESATARPKPARTTTDADSAPATRPAPAATVSAPNGSFEACVIRAESGGDPTAVNPSSGAGGLFGFLPSTWHALGFGGLPEDAPPSEQYAAFAKEYAEAGTAPWAPYDGC